MHKTEIDIPIYFGKLIVILDDSWDFVNEEYGKDWYPKLGVESEACFFPNPQPDGKSEYVVAFLKKPSGSVISHESSHVVHKLFEDRGIHLDTVNDEPFAYFLGWVYQQIEDFMNSIK